jgi:hypothetical protein
MISSPGKMLVLLGLALVCLGLLLFFTEKTDLWQTLWARFPLGRLPGDIHLRGKGFSLHFPWVTCLVLSVAVSILLWIFRK